jgi:hypothetical protein
MQRAFSVESPGSHLVLLLALAAIVYGALAVIRRARSMLAWSGARRQPGLALGGAVGAAGRRLLTVVRLDD